MDFNLNIYQAKSRENLEIDQALPAALKSRIHKKKQSTKKKLLRLLQLQHGFLNPTKPNLPQQQQPTH